MKELNTMHQNWSQSKSQIFLKKISPEMLGNPQRVKKISQIIMYAKPNGIAQL